MLGCNNDKKEDQAQDTKGIEDVVGGDGRARGEEPMPANLVEGRAKERARRGTGGTDELETIPVERQMASKVV